MCAQFIVLILEKYVYVIFLILHVDKKNFMKNVLITSQYQLMIKFKDNILTNNR